MTFVHVLPNTLLRQSNVLVDISHIYFPTAETHRLFRCVFGTTKSRNKSRVFASRSTPVLRTGYGSIRSYQSARFARSMSSRSLLAIPTLSRTLIRKPGFFALLVEAIRAANVPLKLPLLVSQQQVASRLVPWYSKMVPSGESIIDD
jgi:hypothetical protein